MDDTLERVMEIASRCSGKKLAKLAPDSALDQDVHMFGMDVWDFEDELADLFGDFVRKWPWDRFVESSENVPAWPISNILNRLKWGYWRGYWSSHKFERLELAHIAGVIDKGEWFEP